jgi:hypothetical protein
MTKKHDFKYFTSIQFISDGGQWWSMVVNGGQWWSMVVTPVKANQIQCN